jgi:hypothetical protein
VESRGRPTLTHQARLPIVPDLPATVERACIYDTPPLSRGRYHVSALGRRAEGALPVASGTDGGPKSSMWPCRLTGVPRHRRMNVLPMPSAHLSINLDAPVRPRDPGPSVPSAACTDGWFMGIWTRRFLFEYPERVRVVGVHFKPWGFRRSPACRRPSCGTDGCRGTIAVWTW